MHENNVLLDNSIFAGVMSSYLPELHEFKLFGSYYPSKEKTNLISITQFLTAICLFDKIVLESSSRININSLEGIANIETGQETGINQVEWVKLFLEDFVPDKLKPIIETKQESVLISKEACKISYDLMCSEESRKLILSGHPESVPEMYKAASYYYKTLFEEFNTANNDFLNDELIGYASYLHRGLFLQSIAQKEGMTYLPFLYRGKFLNKISPLITIPIENNFFSVKLPLKDGKRRPNEGDLLLTLNKFYYEFLDKLTWHNYENYIPFIGNSILAKAKGDLDIAFDIALDYRNKGQLKRKWDDISQALKNNDKLEYDNLLTEYKTDIEKAAAKLGMPYENQALQTFGKVSALWLPEELNKIKDTLLLLLPKKFHRWGNNFMNRILERAKDPMQMLFVDHVKAITKK